MTGKNSEIFGKLHFGVLNFILTIAECNKNEEKIALISEQQVCGALQKIKELREKLGEKFLEESLDKLSQTFQAAIFVKAYNGSRAGVKIKYIEFGLPKHELLEQIFSQHLSGE